jgi:hypothetical protein
MRERERERGQLTKGPDENRKQKENLSLNLRLLRFLPKIIIIIKSMPSMSTDEDLSSIIRLNHSIS